MPKDMDRRFGVVLKELLNHGHRINTVYDIGANDGRWMNTWKNTFNCKFIMFEANPNNKCEYSLTPGDRYIHQVLSDKDDKTVKFYSVAHNKENTGDSYYKELTNHYDDTRYQVLKTKTLNTIIDEESLPLPDVIKMDTQGAEVDIINGGSKAFANAKLALLEVPVMRYNEGAPNFNEYIDAMYSAGYIPTGIDHIAMRCAVVNQMDMVFVKSDINNEINNHRDRYTGFL